MMKNRGKVMLPILALGVTFMACNKSKVNKAEKSIVEGVWRVSYFSEDGEDETDHFDDYTFEFKDDGKVTATKDAEIKSGVWSIEKESDDDNPTGMEFEIEFAVGDEDDFEDLNDDWDIIENNDDKIVLKDISGGDGSVDVLHFEKK